MIVIYSRIKVTYNNLNFKICEFRTQHVFYLNCTFLVYTSNEITSEPNEIPVSIKANFVLGNSSNIIESDFHVLFQT